MQTAAEVHQRALLAHHRLKGLEAAIAQSRQQRVHHRHWSVRWDQRDCASAASCAGQFGGETVRCANRHDLIDSFMANTKGVEEVLIDGYKRRQLF